jgi:small subunit ribosomal protein S21
MQIIVRDNNVEQALRALKKKLQREGVYREMKLRRHYEKPSEKRARERAAAIRRARKLERKRAEREGARYASAATQCPSPKPPIDPTVAGIRSRCGSDFCS